MSLPFAFALSLALAAEPSSIAPTLEADFDGDGRNETVVAQPSRGVVRLQVRDAAGRKLAEAKAPSPAGDVVPVTLTSGPLGSAGCLIEVVAATDALECRTIWRYRAGSLTPLPIRDASGRALPDCAPPSGWVTRWEREGDGRAAAWTRERSQSVETGALRTRETYAFAGFSLDFDPTRSSSDIGGVPIPAWYAATLYSKDALETLYSRFRLADMRREPTLRIVADRQRGLFALRFYGPKGELLAPIDAYSASSGRATLVAKAGEKTAHVSVTLAGDGTIPFEVQVGGLGPEWDRNYSPAGAWRGGARRVFPSAADEIASEDLVGVWSDPHGQTQTFAIEGSPPYRLRAGETLYEIDLENAAPPFDLLLLPGARAKSGWGITLKGANALERVPLVCVGSGLASSCRAEGPPETLRRMGARVNVR